MSCKANLFDIQKDYFNVKMLSSLPVECQLFILNILNDIDLVRMSRVNGHFYRLCHDKRLWIELLRRRFCVDDDNDPYQRHKELMSENPRKETPRQMLLELLKYIDGVRRHGHVSYVYIKKLLKYNGFDY